MDLRAWAHADLDSVRSKAHSSVIDIVPRDRWGEQADGGGSSITHLLLHLARHHDLAVNTCARGIEPLFFGHRAALGLAELPAGVALAEREDNELSTTVDNDALVAYLDDVFDTTSAWVAGASDQLDATPDSSRRLATIAGVPTDEFDWLHRMWANKPTWWLLQWPAIGHGHAHVGEAISVRNRMGLSPF